MATREVIGLASSWRAQGQIAYSARLLNGGQPVTDTCDFRFDLYDAEFGGRQIARSQHRTLEVTSGTFTTTLGFARAARTVRSSYVEVAVRCPTGSGEYVRMLRRSLSRRYAWFDIRGFQQLAGSLLGTDTGDESPESAPETKSGPPPQVNEKAPDIVDTPRASKLENVGLKLRDNDAGHDGAKQAAALSRNVDRSETSVPGLRRLAGSKGLGRVSSRPDREARRIASLVEAVFLSTAGGDAVQGQEDSATQAAPNNDPLNEDTDATGQESDLIQAGDIPAAEPAGTGALDTPMIPGLPALESDLGDASPSDEDVIAGGPDGNAASTEDAGPAPDNFEGDYEAGSED
ncbi:MAG: hypothetical protein HYY01_13480 [Chloroflexi bacterium]|nr:hypothetical protein [Chloroflexota bacterium]